MPLPDPLELFIQTPQMQPDNTHKVDSQMKTMWEIESRREHKEQNHVATQMQPINTQKIYKQTKSIWPFGKLRSRREHKEKGCLALAQTLFMALHDPLKLFI
ncbi:hypothetical protein I3843_15G065300 [Carya illinoinensis]|nr:hypothetical protein I3843_15G065300 [Carya illinoinensis]